jgi:hypothetical protein
VISFKIASSCNNTPLPTLREKQFLEFWRAVLSQPSKWPECQHTKGLSMLVSVMEIRQKSQHDKSGEYGA